LPKALGSRVTSDETWRQVIEIVDNLAQTNWIALSIALLSFVIVLACQRRALRVPGQVIVLVAAPLAVIAFGLERYGVQSIGHIPAGLPRFEFPTVSPALIGQLLPVALTGALVAFSDAMVLARAFAARHRTNVDANHEMFALGMANAAAALTQGLPVSGSGTRTAVAESAGGTGPMCLVIAACTVLAILAFFTPLLRPVPIAALAGILFAAAWNLCDLAEFRRLWRFRGVGFVLALLTMVGVIAFGMLAGIVLGVLFSVVLVLWHLSAPYDAVLGRMPHSEEYRDVKRHPEVTPTPGVLVYRFSGPLFFANASHFGNRIEELVHHHEAAAPIRHVVIDASGITAVDLSGLEALIMLQQMLHARGIHVSIACVLGRIRDDFDRGGATDALGKDAFFSSVDGAVKACAKALAPQ
jgi:sulfate permease, SulP family